MKKLIVIMLALTLTCALAACSEGQTKVPKAPETLLPYKPRMLLLLPRKQQ